MFFCEETAKTRLGAPVAASKAGSAKESERFPAAPSQHQGKLHGRDKDLSLVAMLKDPFALTPGFEGPKQPPGNKPLLTRIWNCGAAPF